MKDEEPVAASIESIQAVLDNIVNYESQETLDVMGTLAVVYISKQDKSYKLPVYEEPIHKAIDEAINDYKVNEL